MEGTWRFGLGYGDVVHNSVLGMFKYRWRREERMRRQMDGREDHDAHVDIIGSNIYTNSTLIHVID